MAMKHLSWQTCQDYLNNLNSCGMLAFIQWVCEWIYSDFYVDKCQIDQWPLWVLFLHGSQSSEKKKVWLILLERSYQFSKMKFGGNNIKNPQNPEKYFWMLLNMDTDMWNWELVQYLLNNIQLMVCLDINKPWPDLWDPSDKYLPHDSLGLICRWPHLLRSYDA